MAKRRLSKNQSRRIKRNQQQSIERASSGLDINSDDLGPEQGGRIIAHYGKQVDIECRESGDTERCYLRANLEPVATGDRVIWRRGPDTGVIVSRDKRSSLLCRPDSYGNLKPVAANVDQILVTIAPQPEFYTNLIDRYLVVAEINDIKPVLLINKSDLIGGEGQKFDALRSLYSSLGYQTLAISAKHDESFETLKQILAGRTSIFVGQSGVGKSSIIQRLKPEESIEVGRLSDAKGKGRHTTTYSQLFHFDGGGDCIDSPGIREFGLWHLDKDDVIRGFVDIYAKSGYCKFRDCHHDNEPGCAIIEALEKGEISKARFESYRRIVASLDEVTVKSGNDLL